MELREASDHDLVNCYKSLQKLNEDYEQATGPTQGTQRSRTSHRKVVGATPRRTNDSSVG
jgi:hypothetical protein